MKVERSTVVGHPHRPIHPFLHLHMGRQDIGLDLIAVPVVRHRPVTAQAPCGLDAQAPVQLAARRTGPMQISGLGRRDREAPVVDRQRAVQKPIRRLQGGDPGQPQLLDPSILDGLEELLHPPLGRRRVGQGQLDPQFAQRPPTLTQGFPPASCSSTVGLAGDWEVVCRSA